MTFNSDDLNFLVFRYLEEAGFRHTAYVFGNESHITHSNIDGTMVPAGGLVTLLQKALLYTEAELLAMKDEDDGPEVEKIVDSLSLIEAVMPQLPHHKVRKRKAPGSLPIKSEGPSSSNASNSASTSSSTGANSGIQTPQAMRNLNGSANVVPIHRKMGGFDPLKFSQTASTSATNSAASQQLSNHHIRTTNTGPTNGPAAHHHHLNLNVDRFLSNGGASASGKLKAGPNTAAGPVNINNGSKNGDQRSPQVKQEPKQESGGGDGDDGDEKKEREHEGVMKLRGHESEVFMCAWNPKADIIASGSGDSTARIWNFADKEVEANSKVLKHAIKTKDEPNRNKDVTSLDWNLSGELLATGCYDGQARVWSKDGQLLYNLTAHNGPIFALKWNPKGDRVLSAGVDKSTIVWDPIKGVQIQTFVYHTNSALDVDWIADDMFASCSTDQNIHVCKVGMTSPMKTFTGHSNEVNAIRYDSKSKLLASCSDDMSLKIWSLDQDTVLYNLTNHRKEIYTIRWSPLGKIIASASFDHTVKLWDAPTGTLQRSLEKHTEPVYSVGYTPDGKYIASGSFDRSVLLWDITTGKHLMTYQGGEKDGGIFDVGFNYRGDKIGASASDGSVVVLDLRYFKTPIY